MGRSGLDRTADFQKFCGSGLDRIQFFLISIGLRTEKFHSPLISDAYMKKSKNEPNVNPLSFSCDAAKHFLRVLLLKERDQGHAETFIVCNQCCVGGTAFSNDGEQLQGATCCFEGWLNVESDIPKRDE